MGLEATLLCVDNSEWMRNGDFVPSRLQVQEDAANSVTLMKTRQNVENSVGLLTLADTQVRVTLTNDTNKIFKALQLVEPAGSINFVTGIRIAHLALKHRQNKNQKVRIIAFIGSPVDADEKELIRLAKRLKKEKVNVDIINFGEDELNADKLTKFIDTLNGKEQTNHLVTAHPGPLLSEVLLSSPIMAGEDGTPMGQGFEFGIDPTEDPELAMVLRVSMEEQRQRQEDEARRAHQLQGNSQATSESAGTGEGVLAQAELAGLPYNPALVAGVTPDVLAMNDEQQLAMALQMSLATPAPLGDGEGRDVGMDVGVNEVLPGEEVSESASTVRNTDSSSVVTQPSVSGVRENSEAMEEGEDEEEEEDMETLMQSPDFIRSVLSTLPGVNPEEAMQNLEQMEKATKKDEDEKKKEDKS